MRLVLDCNVVVAAARTDGVCREVLRRAVRHHEVILSAPIIREYRAVGARPKHKPYYATMLTIAALLERVALIVEPSPSAFGLVDADDEVYLATALAGGAEVLVTGNTRHFPDGRYGPVEVVTPRAFIEEHG